MPCPFYSPPPTPRSRGLLPLWILRPLLFLICAYSTCHQSLNSNTQLLPTRRTVHQAVQYYVFPAPSVCVGTAFMAQPKARQLFPRARSMRAPTPGYTRVYRQRGFL
jgi:hypothetical protein